MSENSFAINGMALCNTPLLENQGYVYNRAYKIKDIGTENLFFYTNSLYSCAASARKKYFTPFVILQRVGKRCACGSHKVHVVETHKTKMGYKVNTFQCVECMNEWVESLPIVADYSDALRKAEEI